MQRRPTEADGQKDGKKQNTASDKDKGSPCLYRFSSQPECICHWRSVTHTCVPAPIRLPRGVQVGWAVSEAREAFVTSRAEVPFAYSAPAGRANYLGWK